MVQAAGKTCRSTLHIPGPGFPGKWRFSCASVAHRFGGGREWGWNKILSLSDKIYLSMKMRKEEYQQEGYGKILQNCSIVMKRIIALKSREMQNIASPISGDKKSLETGLPL